MNEDKMRVVLGVVMVIAALAGIGMYFWSAGPIDISEIILVIAVVVLILGAVYIILKRAGNVRKGLVSEDEMAKKINYKAGYYAFLSAIWVPLILSFSLDILVDESGNPILATSTALGLVVLIVGMVFIFSYLYLDRKGNV